MKKRNMPVVIWDSGNPFTEKYIRACHQLKREEEYIRQQWLNAYFNCFDYIHPGYVALSQTTQILLNAICNVRN